MSDQQNLTHEEVWDDSALIDSWNKALAEYKKYHSIYASGGTLSEVKKQVQEASNKTSPEAAVPEDPQNEAEQGRQQVQECATVSAPAPQALLGSIRDEGLKKLLMSWYYAGYYTGLFEGQQTQSNSQSQPQH